MSTVLLLTGTIAGAAHLARQVHTKTFRVVGEIGTQGHPVGVSGDVEIGNGSLAVVNLSSERPLGPHDEEQARAMLLNAAIIANAEQVAW